MFWSLSVSAWQQLVVCVLCSVIGTDRSMQREHRESQIKVTLLNTFDTTCIIYKSKSNETKHLNTFKILKWNKNITTQNTIKSWKLFYMMLFFLLISKYKILNLLWNNYLLLININNALSTRWERENKSRKSGTS